VRSLVTLAKARDPQTAYEPKKVEAQRVIRTYFDNSPIVAQILST